MFLKKIHPLLEEALTDNDIINPTLLQKKVFSKIKSGTECYIVAPPQSGKTMLAAISIIQKLQKPFDQSPRALLMVHSRKDLEDIEILFDQLTKKNSLRTYVAREKGELDFEKNMISVGIDIMVGTPKKLGELVISAGYNVNELDLFIVDDLDKICNDKMEEEIVKISNLLPKKTQRIFINTSNTSRTQTIKKRLMEYPTEIELTGQELDN